MNNEDENFLFFSPKKQICEPQSPKGEKADEGGFVEIHFPLLAHFLARKRRDILFEEPLLSKEEINIARIAKAASHELPGNSG